MSKRPSPLLSTMVRHSVFGLLMLLHGSRFLQAQTVLVAPYLQPGPEPALKQTDSMVLTWLTDPVPGNFTVVYQTEVGGEPKTAKAEVTKLDFGKAGSKLEAIDTENEIPTDLETFKAKAARADTGPQPNAAQKYLHYRTLLGPLPLDSTVIYRVSLGSTVVSEGRFKTRASADKTVRFVAVGDMATGKPEQNRIAWQIAAQTPDFMIALGDIVYPEGRVSQYLHHFWTTYNDVTKPGPENGAPLMASLPLYAVLGNHDAVYRKLNDTPDAFGAFYFFCAPANGPGSGPWNTPLGSNPAAAALFRKKVGASYPNLNFYSWDSGPVHLVALDSNGYVDPKHPALQAWLEADLAATKQPWKIVCFHAPAFHTSREHYQEQKQRLWMPLLEKYGVNLVLAGHVHNYQRSKPLLFTPSGPADKRGLIQGKFVLDETFDGIKHTTPEGIIHIVSGGGGAKLYSPDLKSTVEALKKEPGYVPFTAKYVGTKHSFSLVEASPTKLLFRQIAIDGEELDRFELTKP